MVERNLVTKGQGDLPLYRTAPTVVTIHRPQPQGRVERCSGRVAAFSGAVAAQRVRRIRYTESVHSSMGRTGDDRHDECVW
jgi:hypothetical protein